LQGLTRRFGRLAAVDDLSLEVPRGDLLALLGPSGSGKTTTLRLLAGFEPPDSGRILVEGADLTGLAPAARRFGMVFQHYALFPHLDTGENVGFGLETLKMDPEARRRRVRETLELVELGGLERRPVTALSGGQQQRVALARALAPEPRILLLDEPLSNLDPGLRERTRRELRALLRRIGITTILVTHEQEEAFDLADHIALLDRGRLQQVGTPEDLYGAPKNAFVAGFIGRASRIPVDVVSLEGDRGRVRVAGDVVWEASLGGSAAGRLGVSTEEIARPERWMLYVRPEAISFTSSTQTGLSGTITERRYLGGAALYAVTVAGNEGDFTLDILAGHDAAKPGDRVGLAPNQPGSGMHLFPAEDG
jgi:putative spermidine/putrescine transport system ATP-binding protein